MSLDHPKSTPAATTLGQQLLAGGDVEDVGAYTRREARPMTVFMSRRKKRDGRSNNCHSVRVILERAEGRCQARAGRAIAIAAAAALVAALVFAVPTSALAASSKTLLDTDLVVGTTDPNGSGPAGAPNTTMTLAAPKGTSTIHITLTWKSTSSVTDSGLADLDPTQSPNPPKLLVTGGPLTDPPPLVNAELTPFQHQVSWSLPYYDYGGVELTLTLVPSQPTQHVCLMGVQDSVCYSAVIGAEVAAS
jgi:hypothetical protein